jgi:hypothetical protein
LGRLETWCKNSLTQLYALVDYKLLNHQEFKAELCHRQIQNFALNTCCFIESPRVQSGALPPPDSKLCFEHLLF